MWRKLTPVHEGFDAMLCPTASDPVPQVDQSAGRRFDDVGVLRVGAGLEAARP
jgi:hypothetical protein